MDGANSYINAPHESIVIGLTLYRSAVVTNVATN